MGVGWAVSNIPFVSKKDPLIAIQTDWRPSRLQTLGSLFQVSWVEKMRLWAKDEAEGLQGGQARGAG